MVSRHLFFVFFLLIALVSSSSSAQQLTRIDQLVGRTIVGATKQGAVWASYLRPDGVAVFLYSDGTSTATRWRQETNDTVCFSKPGQHWNTCKTISQAGQGLHWWTLGESEPSSQVIMTLPGGEWQTPLAYSGIESLYGKTVIGRTLKDREIWRIDFREDWRFRMASGSNRHSEGQYFFAGDRVCLIFPDVTECRRFSQYGNFVAWVNDQGGYISEVVYVHGATSRPSTEQAQMYQRLQIATMQARSCSADQLNTLRTACVVAAVGEYACATTVGEFIPQSLLASTSSTSVCTSAVQALTNGLITENELGIGMAAGILDKIGRDRMTSDNLAEQRTGAIFRLLSAKMTGAQIEQCMARMESRCR